MISTCNAFYMVKTGDSCPAIASEYGVSLANFYSWNPAVGSECNTLIASDYVCVGIIGRTTVTTTTTSTGSGDGISTPSPIQTGMISTCDSFYLVKSGDSCAPIAAANDISLAQFTHGTLQ